MPSSKNYLPFNNHPSSVITMPAFLCSDNSEQLYRRLSVMVLHVDAYASHRIINGIKVVRETECIAVCHRCSVRELDWIRFHFMAIKGSCQRRGTPKEEAIKGMQHEWHLNQESLHQKRNH
eukprot:564678_1